MIVVNKDMFTLLREYDAVAVTTNSVIKTNGELVMGAGIAKIFKNRFPTLPKELGRKITTYGNIPFLIKLKGTNIISFPTKTHYKDKSQIDLIIESAKRIKTLTDKFYWTKVAIPAPGVGLGGLSWENEVYPALSKLLDDRFIIHFYNGK